MKKALTILLSSFMLFSCGQKPYWKEQSFGLIDSLSNNDTLKAIVYTKDYFRDIGTVYFFSFKNSLYTKYERYRIFHHSNTGAYDMILLWKSAPIDISNNKAILTQYNVFEQAFINFKDSLYNCSATETFCICFKGDTSSIVDMSCEFNSFAYLVQLIQESTKLEDTYSITSAQADSIFQARYGR